MPEPIRFMWESRADFPLWINGDHPTDEDDWPGLSPELVEELHEWCDFHTRHIEEREPWRGPSNAGAVSWDQTNRFVETEGVRLAARVQAELGPAYVVTFTA